MTRVVRWISISSSQWIGSDPSFVPSSAPPPSRHLANSNQHCPWPDPRGIRRATRTQARSQRATRYRLIQCGQKAIYHRIILIINPQSHPCLRILAKRWHTLSAICALATGSPNSPGQNTGVDTERELDRTRLSQKMIPSTWTLANLLIIIIVLDLTTRTFRMHMSVRVQIFTSGSQFATPTTDNRRTPGGDENDRCYDDCIDGHRRSLGVSSAGCRLFMGLYLPRYAHGIQPCKRSEVQTKWARAGCQ